MHSARSTRSEVVAHAYLAARADATLVGTHFHCAAVVRSTCVKPQSGIFARLRLAILASK